MHRGAMGEACPVVVGVCGGGGLEEPGVWLGWAGGGASPAPALCCVLGCLGPMAGSAAGLEVCGCQSSPLGYGGDVVCLGGGAGAGAWDGELAAVAVPL